MNINTLEYCIDIAKYKNFTKVAELHYISQQALSLHIKNLESELGVLLFERTHRSVKTTQAGEAFVKEAEQAIKHIHSAIKNAQYYGSGSAGTINIGINGPTSQFLIMKVVSKFSQKYPLVDIRFKNSGYRDILEKFTRDSSFDIIIVGDFQEIDEEEYEKKRCMTGPVVAVFGKDHPMAKRKVVTPEELLSEQLICLSPDSRPIPTQRMEWYRKMFGDYPTKIRIVDDTDTANMLVSGGFGFTLRNDTLKHGINQDSFVYIPIQGVNEKRSIWLVWRKNNSNPILPKFLEMTDEITE